jgi:transposase
LEERWRKCCELLDSRKTAKEIAGILGVSRVSIQRWKAIAREGGKRAIKAIPPSVPECRLSSEQQRQLGKIITAAAIKEGFPIDLWTTKRIRKVIWKRFKIRYNHEHVAQMLHGLGASCQKPAKQAKEKDARASRGWRILEISYLTRIWRVGFCVRSTILSVRKIDPHDIAVHAIYERQNPATTLR